MDVLIPLAASLLLTAGTIVTGLLVSVTVIARRPRRRTTDELTFRHIPMPGKVDWKLVRTMELYVYGAHYHRPDGTTNALGYEPVEEAARLARSDRKPTYTCYSCGLWKPTMRQTYDGKWKCGDCFCTNDLDCSCGECKVTRNRAMPHYPSKRGEEIRELAARVGARPDEIRCFCNYCKGRAGVHGEDAKALYQAQIDAFRSPPGCKMEA